MPTGIVVAGAFDHAHQQSDLVHVQILQGFAKIELAGQPKTMNAARACLPEIDLVEVGLQDVVFFIVKFQQHRHQGFVALSHQRLLTSQEEVLHQLLGQGAATLNNAPGLDVGQHGPAYGKRRNAEMIVEIAILHRHQRGG